MSATATAAPRRKTRARAPARHPLEGYKVADVLCVVRGAIARIKNGDDCYMCVAIDAAVADMWGSVTNLEDLRSSVVRALELFLGERFGGNASRSHPNAWTTAGKLERLRTLRRFYRSLAPPRAGKVVEVRRERAKGKAVTT